MPDILTRADKSLEEIMNEKRIKELEQAMIDEIVALQIWIASVKVPPGIRLGMEISLSKMRLALMSSSDTE